MINVTPRVQEAQLLLCLPIVLRMTYGLAAHRWLE